MAAQADRTSELGRTVRKLREGRGWSRDTLARRAGVGEATIARIELYGTSPSLGVLTSLATALSVSVASLLTPEPENAA